MATIKEWAQPMAVRKLGTAEHKNFQGVYSYVDDNGLARVSAPAETHRVISIKQADAYKEKIEGRKHGFTISRMSSIAEVAPNITDAHAGYLLYLQCFIDYSGTIVNGRNKPMTRNEIKETLDIKETAFKKFLADMKRLEIVATDKGIYRINERFHFRGESNDDRIIRTFTAKVKTLYKEVSAKDLGFVYKLLPYVHLDTNTICANPYERDIALTEPLSKSEIAELTGMSEKSVYNKMRNLKFDESYVFTEITPGGLYAYYRINPFIFYRKRGRPDPALAEPFLIKSNPFKGKR